MKFSTLSVSDFFKQIQSGRLKSILIHGVNHGFMTTIIETIIKRTNWVVSEYHINELTANKLNLIANNSNFFKQKELIKIVGVTKNLKEEFKKYILDNDFEHFICFVSSDSLPAIGTRSFFETGSDIGSIGCYYDDENVIAKIILQQCKKNNRDINEEALFYLKSHLKGDHKIIKSELDKIFNFTHDKSQITKEDILFTLSDDLQASNDKMCIYFAQKDAKNFLKEAEKLKAQDKNEVLIFRALARYYLDIYNVTSKIEDGQNIETAIKSLYPPIFFKYLDDFRKIIGKHSSQEAINCLHHIQQSEIAFKTNPKIYDIFSLYLGSVDIRII